MRTAFFGLILAIGAALCTGCTGHGGKPGTDKPQASGEAMDDSPGRTYLVFDVGHHYEGDREEETLTAEQAERFFSREAPGNLSEAWLKEIYPQRRPPADRAEKAKEAMDGRLAVADDPGPFADVTGFDSRNVHVRVAYYLGGWRWHHYYDKLALYQVPRTSAVEETFGIVDLDRRLSRTFQGIGHLTPWEKVVEQLGPPDEPEYIPQTFHYSEEIYRKHGIKFIVKEQRVYEIQDYVPREE